MPGQHSAIRHVDIVVSSLDSSLKFYLELLKPLGWFHENTIKGEQGDKLVYLAGPRGAADGALGIRERTIKKRKAPYDRFDLGINHVAFNAGSREIVDERANWVKEQGFNVISGPKTFYNDRYYAVFFEDPDGFKVEIVCDN